jgi:predicted amino acid-binding ACT domain protein
MSGGGTATVVGEDRTVNVTAGKFSDAFAANGVHIYQIDLAAATCP